MVGDAPPAFFDHDQVVEGRLVVPGVLIRTDNLAVQQAPTNGVGDDSDPSRIRRAPRCPTPGTRGAHTETISQPRWVSPLATMSATCMTSNR